MMPWLMPVYSGMRTERTVYFANATNTNIGMNWADTGKRILRFKGPYVPERWCGWTR